MDEPVKKNPHIFKKQFFIVFFLIAIAFFSGWFLKESKIKPSFLASPIRVSGFKFVKPLLVCDTNPEKKFPVLQTLENNLNEYIKKEKENGDIISASIYFQDFKSDGRISINKDENYYPASLNKVAILIALYRLAQLDPDVLLQKIKYEVSSNANIQQEIQPADSAKAGNTYTVGELAEKMIKYSDNNATSLLIQYVKPETIVSLYNDLEVPAEPNIENPEELDFTTAQDMSYFFRVLYNATYLSPEYSEKALELLTNTEYGKGLKAGLPNDVLLAHKFGLFSIKKKMSTLERELHDCGIVYHSKNPYLLCVMTRSSAELPNIEDFIKNVSSMVYESVNNLN